MNMQKMTPQEIQLVKRTFEMVLPLADTFALIFYDRFFFLEPEIRSLFRTDMALQREKLITMLALIVRGLDQPENFVEELKQMGLRHASYRVEPEHYLVMIQAIVWSLNESLGEMVTEEVFAAWEKALNIISDIMLEGATTAA